MAITQGICNSFRKELIDGIHNFSSSGDVFKLALYTSAADLGPTTTAYSSTAEVVGLNYVAGGTTLINQITVLSSSISYVDFADAIWSSSNITARGALLYNSTKANRAILVLDFVVDRSSSGSLFSVRFPVPSTSEAIIRLT